MKWQNLQDSLHVMLFGNSTRHVADLGLATLALSLVASLATALVLSWAYSRFYGARATGSNIHRAFPLISIATAAIFICVQFSLPLSLGLLGSLSIVRFRTPIKEPEEIGFLMLVIASALCCASFNVAFLLVILATTFVALLLLRWQPAFLCPRAGAGTLVIRCRTAQYRTALPRLLSLIETHLTKPCFDSLSTQADDSVLTWSFKRVTPLQSCELEQAIQKELPEATLGLYYSGHANG